MYRLTLGVARPVIARVIGKCAADDETRDKANEVHERLMNNPVKAVGKVVRYRICTNASCLTWPRQLNTIEAYAVCDSPGFIRNGWFEFLGNGPGQLHADSCWYHDLLPGDDSPTFDDIMGLTSKIRVHSDLVEAAGARILLKGYDENAQWIRTQDAGSWIDGEYVGISTSYAYTVKKFSALTDVIKPVTNGPVRLYEYDTALASVVKALAFYENDETHPLYRRSRIPNMSEGSCCGSTDECSNKSLTVRATLAHMPVINDNDPFVLRNLAAMKLMAMAIQKEEQNMFNESEVLEQKALRELERELATYQGSGEVAVVRRETLESMDPVENFL